LDTEFLCAKKEDAILVQCTKMKDFEAPADLYLKLTSVLDRQTFDFAREEVTA